MNESKKWKTSIYRLVLVPLSWLFLCLTLHEFYNHDDILVYMLVFNIQETFQYFFCLCSRLSVLCQNLSTNVFRGEVSTVNSVSWNILLFYDEYPYPTPTLSPLMFTPFVHISGFKPFSNRVKSWTFFRSQWLHTSNSPFLLYSSLLPSL